MSDPDDSVQPGGPLVADAGSPEADNGGARPMRTEDALDVPALATWLAQHVEGLSGEPVVLQFPGGASNLTYLVRYPNRDVIVRRPPLGRKASGAHDMHREFRVQQALRPVFPYVPEVFAFCADEMVLGGQFYVMTRVPGLILRSDVPAGVAFEPALAGGLAQAYVDRLVDLHGVDVQGAGLADLGRGPGYVQRQVSGWSRRYRDARTDDVPDGEDVMAWLAAEQPADVAACVIHNDWRLDNLVLDPADPATVRAALDWEMSTVGDPLMDLGSALAYWVQADDDAGMQAMRRQPTHLPGMPTRDEIVQRYVDRTGLAVRDWRFYEVFGLFRLAVIAQQIWYRYYHGETTNPAFAVFGPAVGYLIGRCRARIGAEAG